jgi:hypothetical protein
MINKADFSSTELAYSDRSTSAGRDAQEPAAGAATVFQGGLALGGVIAIVLALWGMTWGVMILSMRPADPLTSPYADLFLTQDSQASARQILDCGSGDFYTGPIDGRACGVRPATEPFTAAGLRVQDDVTEIQLQIRQNAITLRDLSLVWGAPDMQQTDTLLALDWPEMRVQAIAHTHEQPFSPFLPVQRITISISHAPF